MIVFISDSLNLTERLDLASGRDREPVSECGDLELTRAAQGGDRDALETLLKRHQQALLTLCRGFLHHAEDAEDALQETLIRALQSLPHFRGHASAKTWLSRIAVNVCLERQRSLRRRSGREPLDSPETAEYRGPEPEVLERLAITAALQELPARRRAIFLLHTWEGWTAVEIAASLRCAPWRVYRELGAAYRELEAWRRKTAEE